MTADVRVSIVTYNSAATIAACLDSIPAASEHCTCAISIVDNASVDGSADLVGRKFPDVEVIEPGENLGFGAGHNRVLRTCREPAMLVLNPDARLEQSALDRLLAALRETSDITLVAPRVQYPDGRPQLSFGAFPGLIADVRQRARTNAVRAGEPRASQRLNRALTERLYPDWVSGSCFLARAADLHEAGGFDERFFLYLEDVDLCRRLRAAGKRVMVEPTAHCIHTEGVSHGSGENLRRHFRRSRLYYENKHGTRLGFMIYKLLRARNIDLRWDPAAVWRPKGNSR